MAHGVAGRGDGLQRSFRRKRALEYDQHEIRLARQRAKAMISQRFDLFYEERARRNVRIPRCGDEALVGQRRQRRTLPARRDIERPAQPVQRIDQMRRTGRPAHAFARDAISLGERTGDEHIVVVRGQFHTPIVRASVEEFGIGLVDHQQHIRRQPGMQSGDVVTRQPCADRVVGIVEQDDPCALRHRGEQLVHVGRIVRVFSQHDRRADLVRKQGVERKRIAREQHLVAGPRERLYRAMEAFARTGAAYDPRRIDAVKCADRFAQRRGVGIGVEVGFMSLCQSGEHSRAATHRVLVGRQLDQLAPVLTPGLARNIGMDALDPGFHVGPVHFLARCHVSFFA